MLARRLLRGFVGSAPAVTLYMLYNGTDGTNYAIGAASSIDSGTNWTRYVSNPILMKTGTGWESQHVKDPLLVWDGSQYVMYYSGQDGTNYRIGRATAAAYTGPWTRYGSNPVITLGLSGAYDDHDCAYPVVLHEPADTGKEWKMWYSGVKASDSKIRTMYAYSSDGLSWTKVGMVIDNGAAGAWDQDSSGPATVYKSGSTYYLFYDGWKGNSKQTGYVTFTDPAGTYTKYAGNPVLLNRSTVPNVSPSLTAITNPGSAVVTVATTAAFSVGEDILLASGVTQAEVHKIASIDSGTQVTLATATAGQFGNADGAVMRPFSTWAVGGRSLVLVAGTYWFYASPFQPLAGLSVLGNTLWEGTSRYSASSIGAASWAQDFTTSLALPLSPANSGWDRYSAENPSVIAAP